MKKMVVFLFVVFLISGCGIHSGKVETGKKIDPATVDRISDGSTSGGEILAWFGAPTKSSRLGKEELFVYKYCTTKSSTFTTVGLGHSGSRENCDELSVVLDENGIVKNHGFVAAVK